jgi:toxin YoeB
LTAAKRRSKPRAASPAASEERQAILRAAFRLHLTNWIATDPRIALRIMRLIEDILRSPYSGIGKPEPLRHVPGGAWSRRITDEHRIVYEVNPAGVVFAVAQGHY